MPAMQRRTAWRVSDGTARNARHKSCKAVVSIHFSKKTGVDTARDFRRAQLNNAIAPHQAPGESLRAHADQDEDPRFRQLCQQYLPKTGRHQSMLEEYGRSIGADGGDGIKGVSGLMFGAAKGAVDAMRDADFLRVVGGIVMIRQAQDTFGTFAQAGDHLGEQRLAELGRTGEPEHDARQKDFNQFCVASFVDYAHGRVIEGDCAAHRTGARSNA